jgi:hypothetical protein
MGKKKSKVQAFVLKPWCWYCEREFEDEKGKPAQCNLLDKELTDSTATTSKVEAFQVSTMSEKAQRE